MVILDGVSKSLRFRAFLLVLRQDGSNETLKSLSYVAPIYFYQCRSSRKQIHTQNYSNYLWQGETVKRLEVSSAHFDCVVGGYFDYKMGSGYYHVSVNRPWPFSDASESLGSCDHAPVL